jgi:Kef-type K+ transport system membrane component KefB
MDHTAFPALLITLVAIIVATKLLGELAQRLGQPTVLGELLAGVILGASVLGVLDPQSPVIHALSEIGVLVLLFEIGLHTDIRSLARVGGVSLTVASVGVAVPFALGYLVATWLGIDTLPAIVCGAALTATSVGISARVLSDLGQLERPEGQIVLGAAVIDDVIGLIILSVVAQVVAGGSVDMMLIGKTTFVAIGFIIIALVAGSAVAPRLFRSIERVRVSGALGLIALAFAFLLAWLAARVGSATIIGAFAAGLVLHQTPQRAEIERATTTLGHFFVPIFFAVVGASVDVRTFADSNMLAAGTALTIVAILGKLVSGYAPWWFTGRKLLIGVAMVPRGEVGLIFAQMGLASGALTPVLFSALTLMVMVTTFVTPPVLARIVSVGPREPLRDRPGEGGIDDLVAGTRADNSKRRR